MVETHPGPALADLIASIQAHSLSGTLRGTDPALPCRGCSSSSGTAGGRGGLQGPPHTAPAFLSLLLLLRAPEIHQPPDIYYLLVPLVP